MHAEHNDMITTTTTTTTITGRMYSAMPSYLFRKLAYIYMSVLVVVIRHCITHLVDYLVARQLIYLLDQ